MKKSPVAPFGREQLGNLRRYGIVEYQSVERTVDDISGSAGDYQRKADKITGAGNFPGVDFYQIVNQETDSDNPQKSQKELAPRPLATSCGRIAMLFSIVSSLCLCDNVIGIKQVWGHVPDFPA